VNKAILNEGRKGRILPDQADRTLLANQMARTCGGSGVASSTLLDN